METQVPMEDNIILDLKEIGINTKNWVDSAQDRDYWRALVNAGSISHGVSTVITTEHLIIAQGCEGSHCAKKVWERSHFLPAYTHMLRNPRSLHCKTNSSTHGQRPSASWKSRQDKHSRRPSFLPNKSLCIPRESYRSAGLLQLFHETTIPRLYSVI